MSPITTSDWLFLLDSILVCVKSEPEHQTPTFHNAFSEHICFKLTKYQCFYFRGNIATSKPRPLTVSVTPFHKHLHLTENSCKDQKTLQLFESRTGWKLTRSCFYATRASVEIPLTTNVWTSRSMVSAASLEFIVRESLPKNLQL